MSPIIARRESTAPGERASQIVLQFDKTGSGDVAATDLSHRYLWGTGVDQILADEQVHYDWTPEDYITDALLWPLGDHLGSVRQFGATSVRPLLAKDLASMAICVRGR
jgi:hypothetical protein